MGPLQVIHASRLNANRFFTKGSPTPAVDPSFRVKTAVTAAVKNGGFTVLSPPPLSFPPLAAGRVGAAAIFAVSGINDGWLMSRLKWVK